MQRRLLDRMPLARGRHAQPQDGRCAMELVAWLAGEEHSDEPRCACPVLGAVVRAINDGAGDDERSGLLRPLVPLLVRSRSGPQVELTRVHGLLDHAARVLAPEVARRRGQHAEAAALERIPPVTDRASLVTAAAWARTLVPDQGPLQWLMNRAVSRDPATAWIAAVVLVAQPLGVAGRSSLVSAIRAALRKAPSIARSEPTPEFYPH